MKNNSGDPASAHSRIRCTEVPPEVSAALQFNKWYISQIIIGKEPLKNYEALRPYVTRETISKLKAMDKLDQMNMTCLTSICSSRLRDMKMTGASSVRGR